MRARKETQIQELELRIARLEWAAARQEALTPELEAAMGQRLARVQTQVAAVCRTLDGETKKLADLQRLIGVKQQVTNLPACCLPVARLALWPTTGTASMQPMR